MRSSIRFLAVFRKLPVDEKAIAVDDNDIPEGDVAMNDTKLTSLAMSCKSTLAVHARGAPPTNLKRHRIQL
jgi:hypothetical protein